MSRERDVAERKELVERMVKHLRSVPGSQFTIHELLRAVGESVGGGRATRLRSELQERTGVLCATRGPVGGRLTFRWGGA